MTSSPWSERSEHRLPAVIALLVALALYATLPSTFWPPLRFGVVAVGVVAMIPLIVLNPARMHRETRWSKYVSSGIAFLLVAANLVAFAQLVTQLVTSSSEDGPRLLLAALQVWLTGIIAYALVYWELDRGGPVTRRHAERASMPDADFRFPQDEDADAVKEVATRSSEKTGWVASYFDYFYFSLTNSMAFSPTDTMPLSIRAKALMALESATGFILLGLVIARAVSLLK
ncbi:MULTISPECIES: DUF1345 domain-containing protein [unclassified Frondihabitans]|uniref:DUF1345 domain-containing protein n=1 Tax=unclassified Frondihabitans TaxID=2626248 RepID=UPI000F50AF93|nr:MULTISPECIES: DUF1345 domain-containing protein [unclassified Frondihabitans]RPE78100.1 putative membrane protein [Frondihabitans sp. PhB153]RPF08381.1 putative membrane protein [Frondihabitans sp. PhB161]